MDTPSCTTTGCTNPAVATFETPVGQQAACIPHYPDTNNELRLLFPGTRPSFILSPAAVLASA